MVGGLIEGGHGLTLTNKTPSACSSKIFRSGYIQKNSYTIIVTLLGVSVHIKYLGGFQPSGTILMQ